MNTFFLTENKTIRSLFRVALLMLLIGGCASVEDRPVLPDSMPDEYEQSPGNRFFNYTQALQAKKRGNIKEAISYLEAAVEQDPESQLLKRELTLLYLYDNKFDNALGMIREVLQAEPEDIQSLIILGGVEHKLENFKAAADAYEKVIEIDPSQEKIYLFLGSLYNETGEIEKSLDIYKKATEQFPESFYCHFFLAKAYKENGNAHEAEKWFIKTLKIDDDLIEPRFELLEIYQNRDDSVDMREKIVRMYKDILNKEPDNVRAEMDLGLYYQRIGMNDAFHAVVKELADKSLTSPRITRKFIFLFFEQGRFSDALILLKGMLEYQPDSSDLNYLAGVAYNETKDTKNAMEAFKKVTPDSRFFESAAVHVAFCYKDNQQMDEAIQYLEQAVSKTSANMELHLYLGAFYEENAEYDKAEGILKKALEADHRNTRILFRLGVVYDKWAKKEASIDQMKKVIEIDPLDAHALNYLGYTYLDLDRNLEEAERLILKAVELKPDDGYIIDSLGWLYYKTGKIEEALKTLEKAVQLVPDDPIILEHLGEVYLETGQTEKALQMFKRSLSHSKNGNRSALEAKIKQLSENGMN